MIDILKGEINFLKSAWQNLLGRPLVTLVLRDIHLGIFFKYLFFLLIFTFLGFFPCYWCFSSSPINKLYIKTILYSIYIYDFELSSIPKYVNSSLTFCTSGVFTPSTVLNTVSIHVNNLNGAELPFRY